MSSQDSANADIPPNSRVISLTNGPVPIGRASAKDGDRSAKTSNLFIRNSHLSKSHARVWTEDKAVFLEDNGSTFGTVWNNNLLVPQKPVAIYEGDYVGFVINKPSYVVKNLLGKALSSPMVLLNKLLNPHVRLQFVVHSIDLQSETLVLLPVNDNTADASVELVLAESNDLENTPDVTVQIGDSADLLESDNEAPAEEKIVKEVSFADEPIEIDVVEFPETSECILVAEESNDEEDVEEDDEGLVLSSEDEEDSEEEEDDSDEVIGDEEELDEDEEEQCSRLIKKLTDEQDLSDGEIQNTSSATLLVHPWPSSDDDNEYDYESYVEDEDTMINAVIEDDEDLEHVCVKKIVKCKIDDCRVPGVEYLFEEDYNSDEDDTFDAPGEDAEEEEEEEDSELDDASLCSDGECIFNSNQYIDDDTVSEDGSPYEGCCYTLSAQNYQPPLCGFQAQRAACGTKRSYDDAELDEDEEVVPAESKRAKKPSTLRTVLKEVGKGALYVTGTLIALAAYGSSLESR